MSLRFGHKVFSRPDGSSAESWEPFTCAYCGAEVSGAVIATVGDGIGRLLKFLQCSKCHEGSVATGRGEIFPGVAFGPPLRGLPSDVEAAYGEAHGDVCR